MQSYDGSSALHLAVMDELDDICALLMNYGADPNILNYVDSSTSSDNEYDFDSDDENVNQEEDSVKKGQSPLDLAKYNLTVNIFSVIIFIKNCFHEI